MSRQLNMFESLSQSNSRCPFSSSSTQIRLRFRSRTLHDRTFGPFRPFRPFRAYTAAGVLSPRGLKQALAAALREVIPPAVCGGLVRARIVLKVKQLGWESRDMVDGVSVSHILGASNMGPPSMFHTHQLGVHYFENHTWDLYPWQRIKSVAFTPMDGWDCSLVLDQDHTFHMPVCVMHLAVGRPCPLEMKTARQENRHLRFCGIFCHALIRAHVDMCSFAQKTEKKTSPQNCALNVVACAACVTLARLASGMVDAWVGPAPCQDLPVPSYLLGILQSEEAQRSHCEPCVG